ncbi:MAG: disulfide bond formation protein B [Chromatiaceae bacterium]
MTVDRVRKTWLILATGSATLAVASILVTHWLGLQPCHLCIFQRLLFMLIAVLALGAALLPGPGLARLVTGGLVALAAAGGTATAAYQTWLQEQPPGAVACLGSELSPIERLVEWLGQLQPDLFLATGFCEDKALVVFGLSLVQWALLCFILVLLTTLWSWFQGSPGADSARRGRSKPVSARNVDAQSAEPPAR